MREYLRDVRDNWRDDYWRADHPEFQMAVAIAGFLIMGVLRIALHLVDLLIARRFGNVPTAAV